MFNNILSHRRIILGFILVYLLAITIIIAVRFLGKNISNLAQTPSPLPMKNGCLATKPISFKEVAGKVDSIDNNSITINGQSYNLKSTLKVYQVKSKPLSVIYQVDQLGKQERIEVDKTHVQVGDIVSGLDICNVEKDPQAEKGIYIIYVFRT